MVSKRNRKASVKAKTQPSRDPSYIVGIGASAGGLEAIERFFGSIPKETSLAFVLVQHLSPDFKSLMKDLLSRQTQLPIRRVEDGMTIERGTIYLNTPSADLAIEGGKLRLLKKRIKDGINLPIDTFFSSLATEAGDRAVAIVLSGSGSDGSRGVHDIAKKGGVVLVQDPNTAQFDSMPKMAIATRHPKFVLPPEDLAHLVELLEKTGALPEIEDTDLDVAIGNNEPLSQIFQLLKDRFGIDFSHYKSGTVLRRIKRRIALNNIGDIGDLALLLKANKAKLSELYFDLLIGVTKFFRDVDSFNFLEREVIPDVFKASMAADAKDSIRVWVPGCATGEEAYSIAILFREYMEKQSIHREVKIFATDVHMDSIEYANRGVYTAQQVGAISPDRLKKFFQVKGSGYRVESSIRKMVVFAHHNVIANPPFTRTDMISCRNMLIYFRPSVQRKVLENFYFSLKKDGYLFLGPSETLGDLSPRFKTVDNKRKVFRKIEGVTGRGSLKYSFASPVFLPIGNRVSSSTSALENRMLKLYEKLTTLIIPCGFLVGEEREILHVYGNAGAYLEPHEGRVSLDIIQMLGGDLRLGLTWCFHQTVKSHKISSYDRCYVDWNGQKTQVRISVYPVSIDADVNPHYLIRIDPVVTEECEKRESKRKESKAAPSEKTMTQRGLRVLENELRRTREQLQSLVEELETSNEELQSTNEELIASNEELQSTNEELQSTNEELHTVNAEHERKIEELARLNTDINQLMESADIASLFLDNDLKIRKFTPLAEKIFNLMNHDVGRSIEHIRHNLIGDNVIEAFFEALRSKKSVVRQLKSISDSWYVMKAIPYAREEKEMDGMVVTFVDITAIKASETDNLILRGEKAASTEIVDIILRETSSPILALDQNAVCIFANEPARRTFVSGGASVVGLDVLQFFDELQAQTIRRALGGKISSLSSLSLILKREGKRELVFKAVPVSKRGDKTRILLIAEASSQP